MPNEKQEEQTTDATPTTKEKPVKIPTCQDCKKLGKLKAPANEHEGTPIE